MVEESAQEIRTLRTEAEETPDGSAAANFAPPLQASEGGSRSDPGPGQDLRHEGSPLLPLDVAADELPPDLDAPYREPLAYGPKTMNWWYPKLADWMLENPDKYLKDAARVFDVTPSWLYALFRSDTFQDYWQKRSGEVSRSVEHKAKTLADRLLDSMHQDLDAADQTGMKIPLDTRLRVLDVTMKRFGYGDSRPVPGITPPAQVQAVTINALGPVSPAELTRARERLASATAKQIEATATEESSS